MTLTKKYVAEKVVSSQDCGLILKVEPTEVSSGLDVQVRESKRSGLTSF